MGSVIKLSGLSCDYWKSMLGSKVAVATGVMSSRPVWHAKNIFRILRFYLEHFKVIPFFNIHLSPVLLQWTSQAMNIALLKRLLVE